MLQRLHRLVPWSIDLKHVGPPGKLLGQGSESTSKWFRNPWTTQKRLGRETGVEHIWAVFISFFTGWLFVCVFVRCEALGFLCNIPCTFLLRPDVGTWTPKVRGAGQPVTCTNLSLPHMRLSFLNTRISTRENHLLSLAF